MTRVILTQELLNDLEMNRLNAAIPEEGYDEIVDEREEQP